MNRHDFSGLALSYVEELAAYARRLCRNDWDADDLLQGVFEQAFRSWTSLSDEAHCRAWLFRIARNLHIDRGRRSAARPELRLVDPGDAIAPSGFISAEHVERLDAHELEAALLQLPAEQREALLLCDLWGFRYEEIAVITGVPVGTVRSRISRARSLAAGLLLSGRRPASVPRGKP
ncbi:MAG: RNA polymerase sigma factor [Candidatus Binatia bacterium]